MAQRPRCETLFVDKTGRQVPMDNDVANAAADEIFHKGDLVAVITRHDDALSVHVLGEPTQELLECLEQAAAAYRKILQGQ